MEKSRILELAGIKKAVGNSTAFMLNESETAKESPKDHAKRHIRGLPIWKELMKDKKAKPHALKKAKEFMDDHKDDHPNHRAKKWVHDELHHIAHKHNPGGAMMSKDDDDEKKEAKAAKAEEKEAKKAPPVEERKGRSAAGNKPGQGLRKASNHREEARKWHHANPKASAAEHKKKFGELYDKHNPKADADTRKRALNGARSLYHKTKKKLPECYVIRQAQSGKILSERSSVVSSHWIDFDDYNSDFVVRGTLKEAKELRDSLILRSNETLQIMKLVD